MDSVSETTKAALKPSQFNAYVFDYPEPGRHLVYNTLSRAFVCLQNESLALLQDPTSLQEYMGAEKDTARNVLEQLRQQGLTVPVSHEEGKLYQHSLETIQERKGGSLNITLLTTLSECPLACTYCYQRGTHTGKRLDAESADRIVHFIQHQCETTKAEALSISYYGSEPLTHRKAIFTTAQALRDYTHSHQIRFAFGMVTNGVLLTRKLVEELVPLGFRQAQVTIDGNRDTHNGSRPFQNGAGSYDTIMQNLNDYAGLIHTDILCVLDEAKIPAAYELIDMLAAQGFADRKVRVKFSPMSVDYSPESMASMTRLYLENENLLLSGEERMVDAIADLCVYAAKRGLFENLLPQRTWCAMLRHDGRYLVIEPDGSLRTCPGFIGRGEETLAGDIATGLGGVDTFLQIHYERASECLECTYLPICADCRIDALAKRGSLLASRSLKSNYERIIPRLMRAHYQQRWGKEAQS